MLHAAFTAAFAAVVYFGHCSLGTATGVVLIVGGVALYLRFVKGWRLTDLMYVTRSSLSSLTESMKSGGLLGSSTSCCWAWGTLAARHLYVVDERQSHAGYV